MKYASSSGATTDKMDMEKLDPVQSMGLKITLEAIRSTSIKEIEKTLGSETLRLRRKSEKAS